MYTPMNECVCLCVHVCVRACRGAHLCTNGRGRRTRENPQCCQMFKRRSHVIKESTCEHVSACGGVRLQRRARRRTEPESCAVQVSAHVQGAMWHWSFLGGEHAYTWVCKLTPVFRLTAGAEMDNQDSRESGSVCVSVVGRDHLSQGFAETGCFCV